MKNQITAPLLVCLILFISCIACNKNDNSSELEEYGWHESMTGKMLIGIGIQLYVIDAEGTKEITLSEEIKSVEEARWSPDGTKIVFVGHEQGIVIINQDGSGETIIFNNDGCKSPVWSPDGSRIAFILNDSICLLSLGNSNLTIFEQPLSKLDNLDWSPNSTKIAFTDNPAGDDRYIKILDILDSSTTVICHNTLPILYPSWSPNGNEIAFRSRGLPEEENFQIFKVDANGNNIVKLSHFSTKLCISYTPWSPSGKLTALTAYDAIYILDLNGTIITKLKIVDFCCSLDWH